MPTAHDRSTATGDIRVYDSSLCIWFDRVDKNADQAFRLVKALLNKRGFRLREDPNIKKNYACLNPCHRLGRKGELEVAVSLGGRSIQVMFFQNIYNVENRHGGRFDFDKLERMPYLMRKRVELEHRGLTTALQGRYPLKLSVNAPHRPSPMGATNLQVIDLQNRASGHYRNELGRCDWHGDYNRRTGDDQLLEHGTPVYFTDNKGRWMQGRAYYQLNNMWWVAFGLYGLTSKGCSALRVGRPEVLRKKENGRASLERVSRLIAKAVQQQDFLRAHELKLVQQAKTENA